MDSAEGGEMKLPPRSYFPQIQGVFPIFSGASCFAAENSFLSVPIYSKQLILRTPKSKGPLCAGQDPLSGKADLSRRKPHPIQRGKF
jgi:hypothetical protein